jgi:hypothetical protein
MPGSPANGRPKVSENKSFAPQFGQKRSSSAGTQRAAPFSACVSDRAQSTWPCIADHNALRPAIYKCFLKAIKIENVLHFNSAVRVFI